MLRRKQAEQPQEIQTVEDLEAARRRLAQQAAEFWRTVKSLDAFEPTPQTLAQAKSAVQSEIRLPDDYAPSKPLADALSELTVVLARAIAGRAKLANEKQLLHPTEFPMLRAKLMGLVNDAVIAKVEAVIWARITEKDRILEELRQLVRQRIKELRESVQPEVWELYLALERRTPNTPRETPLEAAAVLSIYGWGDKLDCEPHLTFLNIITNGEASRALQKARVLEAQPAPGRLLGHDFWAPLA